MVIQGILSALVVGTVIGALARFVLAARLGRGSVGLPATFLVGLAAALVGGALAHSVGITGTTGAGWAQIAVQTALAVAGLAAVARLRGGTAARD